MDRPDTLSKNPLKGRAPSDEPGFVDGIPVEELVRLTKEFTARITNEDRQRLTAEATEGGRSIQSGAPFILNQFFTGKIDLDTELSRRYPSAPLLSSAAFAPAPGKRARRGFAQFRSQDEACALNIDLQGIDGALEASFLYGGMIAARFALGPIPDVQRKRFLDLMRRPNGIAILWTRERWERDYMVFVVRERFARVYAFGQGHFDAACRLPPEALENLLAWLNGFWITDAETLAGRADEQNPSW
jgi:hypothetical protein